MSLTRAMTIARTEQMRAYRGAHIGYLRENAEHIAGWVWHADHGWRTCPVCLAMDGTFHDLSEDFASHPNCRCSPVTVAIGPDGKPELPERETGEQWFSKLPSVEQKELLGPRKYALYKDGKITLRDLVKEGHDPQWGHYRVEKSLKAVEAGLARLQKLRENNDLEGPVIVSRLARLVQDGVSLTPQDIAVIQDVVSRAGFGSGEPSLIPEDLKTRLPKRILEQIGERADSLTLHWLKHGVVGEEWGREISRDEYLAEVNSVIQSGSSGIAVVNYQTKTQITFVGRTRIEAGHEDGGWTVVHYRTDLERISSAYRTKREHGNLESVSGRQRWWIRRP